MEEKLNINAKNVGPTYISLWVDFQNNLIQTVFDEQCRQCLMKAPHWWTAKLSYCIKGCRGTVDFCDWCFWALWWIVCMNRRHVPQLFIGSNTVIIYRVNILMAEQLLDYSVVVFSVRTPSMLKLSIVDYLEWQKYNSLWIQSQIMTLSTFKLFRFQESINFS